MRCPAQAIAICLTALLTLGVFILGIYMLTLPPITLFRVWPYYILPRAEVMICTAITMAWFRSYIIEWMLWAGKKIYRWLSALLVFAAMGADGMLHLMSIPHMEGWWIPLLGTGATLSFLTAWIEKHKKKL